MKKTLNVNIGGRVFHIDEDAYDMLNQYLNRVREELRSSDGGTEIHEDIETRIGELFANLLGTSREIITTKDVLEVINIMGQPEDISGNAEKRTYSGGERSYRRMYRDPDKRIIGGVCSGLAAYWRTDPTIVRLIFIVLFLFGMAGGFIYIILWIILPEANTVAKKLEMRGEPVNLSNMGEFFRDEFENVKRSFKRK
jgi:phage shock protein PspC (stress-responsive transcriptional regulator)